MKKIVVVYGTRPEIIKLIPVINELKKSPYDVTIINTGQHKEMVQQLEADFNIVPDISLDVMMENQSLTDILVNVAKAIDPVLKSIQPDLVLLQGDTSTVATVGTVCFYNQYPVGHVEAGLRSFDMMQPFPEEFNRRLISLFATLNFAPTTKAQDNLIAEGVDSVRIYVTGNTVVDMIYHIRNEVLKNVEVDKRKILITAHRRENHAEGIANICTAINRVSERFPDVKFVWPIHPNPNVRKALDAALYTNRNVTLCDPLNYMTLTKELSTSYIVWTDSGGIQEECPSFVKPVLILRNVTERPEVIDSGFGVLTGTNVDEIYSLTEKLLTDETFYLQMTSGKNPFGDGDAAQNIVNIIKRHFDESSDN
jgi:UDP-N-acetylglucosamine 2-epimerase (non-hydrolysing)